MDKVRAFDRPGMIEAKILLPNSTSTPLPLKPFSSIFQHQSSGDAQDYYRESPNQTFVPRMSKASAQGAHDSGYNSLLSEERDSGEKTGVDSIFQEKTSTSDESISEQPSLFASLLKSRNHSISLEQLIEKVHLKKEIKNEKESFMTNHPRGHGRLRSFSASEVHKTSRRSTASGACSGSSRGSISNLSLYSDLSVGGGSRWSVSGSQSPSPMDQAFLMSSNMHRQPRHSPERLRSYSGGDYDISELVANMRLAQAHMKSTCTPSPEAATYRRTPESLFGLEALQGFQGQGRSESRRPKLESISETEQDLCVTPEEYYTTGVHVVYIYHLLTTIAPSF